MTTPDLDIPLPYTVQYFSSSQDNGWLHIPEGQQTTAVAATYRYHGLTAGTYRVQVVYFGVAPAQMWHHDGTTGTYLSVPTGSLTVPARSNLLDISVPQGAVHRIGMTISQGTMTGAESGTLYVYPTATYRQT